RRDPSMRRTIDGPAGAVGSSYAWHGNDKVGEGKMTVTDATPPASIAYRLELVKPFPSVAAAAFHLRPDGEKGVRVTWSMAGNSNLVAKVFGIFMNVDKMIGGDFE